MNEKPLRKLLSSNNTANEVGAIKFKDEGDPDFARSPSLNMYPNSPSLLRKDEKTEDTASEQSNTLDVFEEKQNRLNKEMLMKDVQEQFK